MTTIAKREATWNGEIAPDTDFIGAIRDASSAELREKLADGLRLTSQRLVMLGAIVQELERRGEDLAGLRLGMVRWLRSIASGQLLPEVVVRFAGKQRLLERIAAMPIGEQRKLIADPTVTIVAAGKSMKIDALAIPYRAIDQVFADDHVRDDEEQEIYIASQSGKADGRKRRDKEDVREREPHADLELGGIRVGKSFVPKAKIVIELAKLSGPLPIIDRRDETYETCTVKVTPEEKARLRAQEKLAGLSEWELIRQALRACGLI